MNQRNFFAELKRRNVYKVAVAYAVVSWLLIQVATQVFPFLEIPNWVVRLVIAIVVIGFPIALVIAWAFEATPEGIKRTEIADAMRRRRGRRSTPSEHSSGRKIRDGARLVHRHRGLLEMDLSNFLAELKRRNVYKVATDCPLLPGA